MKKVCIVGSNKLTRHLIDWDQDADYWLFNEAGAHPWAKRVTGVFQMHAPAIWRNRGNVNDAGHYDWLQQRHPFPIWMQERYPDVPSSRAYPLAAICAMLLPSIQRKNGEDVRYFTSSAAYAIALAIWQGYDEIELYGIEMASGTEYAHQRDGVTFWLGVAAGHGVQVTLQNQSGLLNRALYGYEGEIVIHRQRFEIVEQGLRPKVEGKKAEALMQNGAVALLLKQLAAETDQARAQKLYGDLAEAIQTLADVSFHYGLSVGALAENQKYIGEVDELIKAAGGERTLASLEAVQ